MLKILLPLLVLLAAGVLLLHYGGCVDRSAVIDATDMNTYNESFNRVIENMSRKEMQAFGNATMRITVAEKARLLKQGVSIIDVEQAARQVLNGKTSTEIIALSEEYPQIP